MLVENQVTAYLFLVSQLSKLNESNGKINKKKRWLDLLGEGVMLASLDFRRITMTPNRIPTRHPPSIPKCTKPPHAINTPDLTLLKIAQQKLGSSLSF